MTEHFVKEMIQKMPLELGFSKAEDTNGIGV
jgi:hypothetical protein